jgi:hypothetical protein
VFVEFWVPEYATGALQLCLKLLLNRCSVLLHHILLQVALNGRFAFVEFRVPEYATAALQLNGQIALMGNTLKIARPASYVEPAVRVI